MELITLSIAGSTLVLLGQTCELVRDQWLRSGARDEAPARQTSRAAAA
jgi:hypothetical protein